MLYLLSLISLAITIVSMCVVLFWVMFRHDATPVIHIVKDGPKKEKKITYKNDGTQDAYLVAIIAGIVPWTAIFGYLAKMYSINAYLYSEYITDMSTKELMFGIFSLAIIAMLLSLIFYNFIRECGAESHCKRDIQYVKNHK